MDVPTSVEKSFRELLDEKPCRKITAAEICERANIAQIFRRDIVQPEMQLHSFYQELCG